MDNHQTKELFLNHLKLKGFSPRTLENYRSYLNHFLDYLAAKQKTISKLTPDDLQDFRTALYYREYRGRPLSIATQHQQLAIIRAFFKFLTNQNLILINYATALELPKLPRNLPRTILSAHEAKKILESIDTQDLFGLRDRAILEILYSTGIRVTELINLTLEDLNLAQGFLRVVNGKGGKDRVVPLGEVAIFYIKKYLQIRPQKASQTIFLSKRSGLPLARSNIEEMCARRAMQSGVKKKVTPHVWRHTCATLMLKSGADIRYIQELLGHTSLKTTQIYTKVTVKDLKKIHARFHPREKELQLPKIT